MSRGNQREIDRARAAARAAGKGTKSEGGDPARRREADGNALQAKVEAKKKAAEAAAVKTAAEEEVRVRGVHASD